MTKRLLFVRSFGFVAFLLCFVMASQQSAGAVSNFLFHDSDVNPLDSLTCDVYNYNYTQAACDRGVRLKVSQTGDVPNGYVPARLYFKNIPVGSDGKPDGTKEPFLSNKLTFEIQGSDFCGKNYGDSSKGANNRDRLNKGYWGYNDSNPGQLQPGVTQATDYSIRDPSKLTSDPDAGLVSIDSMSTQEDVGRKSGLFHIRDSNCKSSGVNYTHKFAVPKQYLQRDQGLLPGVFYIELIAQTAESVDRSGKNPLGSECNTDSATYETACAGIANAFTVVETSGYYDAIVTAGSSESVNVVRAAQKYINASSGSIWTGWANILGGSAYWLPAYKQIKQVQMNLTFQSAKHPYFNSDIWTDPNAHASYSFPFSPDCSLLKSNTRTTKSRIALYDIDHTNSSVDIIKGLLLRFNKDGGVEYLDPADSNGYSFGLDGGQISAPLANVGTWKDTGFTETQINSGSKDLRVFSKDLPSIDGKYQSLNFESTVGYRYKFVLMSVADTLVNQVGVPFDAAFDAGSQPEEFRVTNGPCDAVLSPSVDISISGTNYTAGAGVDNTAPLKISATGASVYVRRVFYADASQNPLSVINQFTKTTTQVYERENKTDLNDWTGSISSPPLGTKFICTDLSLAPNTSGFYKDEENQTIYPTVKGPVKSCQSLAVSVKPHFNVLGGDILSLGNIIGNNSANDLNGAYSQIAAFSKGNITKFLPGYGLLYWDVNNGVPAPNPVEQGRLMTFANKKFNGGVINLKGQYGTLPLSNTEWTSAGATDVSSFGSIDLGNLGSLPASATGDYVTNNNISVYGTLPVGKNIRLFVNNAYALISSNITYQDAGSNLSQIPHLTLIANGGDIIVGQNATEVHGVFYAGNSTTRGRFFTCGLGGLGQYNPVGYTSFTPLGVSGNYVACNKQLVIYGAVSASKVIMSRTNSSASSGVQSPAETFYYTAESWFRPSSTPGYDSYVNMPPLL